MIVACACGGVGEALVLLYFIGSALVGWISSKLWRRGR